MHNQEQPPIGSEHPINGYEDGKRRGRREEETTKGQKTKPWRWPSAVRLNCIVNLGQDDWRRSSAALRAFAFCVEMSAQKPPSNV